MTSKLTTRVTIGLLATVGLGLGIAAFAAWLSARHVLLGELDRHLAHMAKRQAHRGEPSNKMPKPPRGGDFHLLIIHPSGSDLYRSPDWPPELQVNYLPDQVGRSQLIADVPYRLMSVGVTDAMLMSGPPPDGNRGRRRSQPLPSGSVIIVAAEYQLIQRDLNGLALILLCTSMVTLLLAWLVTRSLRTSILRPLTDLAADIDGLPADDPAARLPEMNRPQELMSISNRIDGFLAEVDASRARERRALAATAHELRTPLAELCSRLGFARRAAEPHLDADAIDQLAEQVDVLADQVDRLLILSRLEAGTQPVQPEPWDWVDFISSCWQGITDDRQLIFTGATAEDLLVDPILFPLALRNLLENAYDHGQGSNDPFVIVDLKQTEDEVILTVSNPTALTDGDMTIAAEPYWQADQARSDERHSGLGLSIVQTIAAAHNGRLDIKVVDQRFQVRVILPRVDEKE